MRTFPAALDVAPLRAALARFAATAAAVLTSLLFSGAALADPPGRVGRLAELQGTVWVYEPEQGEWVAATRNRPVTAGDRISTARGGRAELRVGSTTLRLAGGSELEAVQLDDERMQWQLHSGSVAARLRSRETAQEFELLTGEGRFLPESGGHYRVDRIDDTSTGTVWAGRLRFEGHGETLTLERGQRAELWRDGTTRYSLSDAERDAFADWVAARDREDERSASSRYASPEMTGIEDLDRHGRWEQSPDYGPLWVPYAVAPGWAPYRYGSWTWVNPWGWTWVDDAPWGFAPFHYGRWVHLRGHWSWSPGHYVARPVYAPALVAWVGGPRASFSVSVGSAPAVGWFPLGPREVFVPSYRVSPRYVRNVNITHVTNINNVTNIVNDPGRGSANANYINRSVGNAMTVVPASVLTNREPVGPVAVRRLDPRLVRELSNQPVLSAAPVATPVARAVQRDGVPRGRAFVMPTPADAARDRDGRPAQVALPPPVVGAPAAPGTPPRVLSEGRPQEPRVLQREAAPQPRDAQPPVPRGAMAVPLPPSGSHRESRGQQPVVVVPAPPAARAPDAGAVRSVQGGGQAPAPPAPRTPIAAVPPPPQGPAPMAAVPLPPQAPAAPAAKGPAPMGGVRPESAAPPRVVVLPGRAAGEQRTVVVPQPRERVQPLAAPPQPQVQAVPAPSPRGVEVRPMAPEPGRGFRDQGRPLPPLESQERGGGGGGGGDGRPRGMILR